MLPLLAGRWSSLRLLTSPPDVIMPAISTLDIALPPNYAMDVTLPPNFVSDIVLHLCFMSFVALLSGYAVDIVPQLDSPLHCLIAVGSTSTMQLCGVLYPSMCPGPPPPDAVVFKSILPNTPVGWRVLFLPCMLCCVIACTSGITKLRGLRILEVNTFFILLHDVQM